MKCPATESWVDYIGGEVLAKERAALEKHLETCSSCKECLDAFAPMVSTFRRAEAIQPPAGLRGRILADVRFEIERTKPWYRRFFERQWIPWSAALVGAAAAVAAFVIGPQGMVPSVVPPVRLAQHQPAFVPVPAVVTPPQGVSLQAIFGQVEDGTTGAALKRHDGVRTGQALLLAKGTRAVLDWKGKGCVTVEGPSRFSLLTNGLSLGAGHAFCSVEPGAEGFKVETARVDVSVVGTSFRVSASEGGDTEVEVFGGKVCVQERTGADPVMLTKGETRTWQSAPAVTGVAALGDRALQSSKPAEATTPVAEPAVPAESVHTEAAVGPAPTETATATETATQAGKAADPSTGAAQSLEEGF